MEGVTTEEVTTEEVTTEVDSTTTTIITEAFIITVPTTGGAGDTEEDMGMGIAVGGMAGDLGSDVPFSLFS